MKMDGRPLLAVTMGDPAGIGPEICARAFAEESVRCAARCILYGDERVLVKAAELVGVDLASAREDGSLRVVDLANASPSSFEPGAVSPLCGRAAWEYVEAAGKAALAGAGGLAGEASSKAALAGAGGLAGEVSNKAALAGAGGLAGEVSNKAALAGAGGLEDVRAVVTAPINKESVRAAGVPHIGHTEMLGAIAGTADPLTMFETLGLRSFFLTRHVSLREACDLVTKERLFDYIERCAAALAGLGAKGELAVAGLNPHCGEHGLFGDEEGREVEPAIAAARAKGIAVVGPIGADSVFHLAKIGRYAAVLSLYHDQGHIACKTLDFERTVSLTLGMPFLRTSVDHGTAFDIAWKGEASPIGMIEAILAAARYAPTGDSRR